MAILAGLDLVSLFNRISRSDASNILKKLNLTIHSFIFHFAFSHETMKSFKRGKKFIPDGAAIDLNDT